MTMLNITFFNKSQLFNIGNILTLKYYYLKININAVI
jgi:hypothetical protein